MFIIKFMQENYHFDDVTFSLFDFWEHKDEHKCIQLIAEPFDFLMTMATDSELNLDYYSIYLVIIHPFYFVRSCTTLSLTRVEYMAKSWFPLCYSIKLS